MDEQLRRLFPAAGDRDIAIRILTVLYDKPDKPHPALELITVSGVGLAAGLVTLARLTHAGLIDHPAAGTYQVAVPVRVGQR